MRKKEKKYLRHFTKAFLELFPEGGRGNDIILNVTNKKLLLEPEVSESSIKIDNECINKIKEVLPYLFRILEKPHTFIVSYEDKLPVSTAKRISKKAITHLTQDSNDWFGRTFLSIIPKNILSEQNEETFSIYENRFVVTLIDKLYAYIQNRYNEIDKLYRQLENERAQKKLEERGYIRFSAEDNLLLKSLLRKGRNPLEVDITINEVYEERQVIKKLKQKLYSMKQSVMYSDLKRCRPVNSPIQKTNILIFDHNYNMAYRMWEYLYKVNNEYIITIEDNTIQFVDMFYNLYLLISIFCVLQNMKYTIDKDTLVMFKNNKIYISNTMIWKNSQNGIKINLEYYNDEIKLEFYFINNNKKFDTIIITPNYNIDFEDKIITEIVEEKQELLNYSIQKLLNEKINISYFYSLSIDVPHCCGSDNDWGTSVYRNLYNIGDNYPETEQDINLLSNYKSGMIIITPDNFQTNFSRLERLINSRIFRHTIKTLDIEKCPICGSSNIKKINNGKEILCFSCKHNISISLCKNCNNEFLWIKYIDDKFLKIEEVTEGIERMPYYYQILRYESIMGEYAITSFTIEKENEEWKLKSLCPKCGHKLGE
ncbi:MAG: DUF2357 domain-containing protein [Spirochaetaceae bacterium]|jgi:rRNA maturation protein Nop10|nr:DUF2357 domain-containing protein [Spirochaetaceae bacterium]